MNLGSFVTRHAEEFPDKTAVISADRRVTYREYDERTNRLANGLAALGLAKGDKVATVLEGCLEYPELFFACAKHGMVFVPMVTRRLDDEIDKLVARAEAQVLVVGPDHLSRVASMREQGLLAGVRHFIHIGDDGLDDSILYEEVLASGDPEPPAVEVVDSDPVCFLSTGGTTGLPKLAVHTHESVYLGVSGWHWNVGYRPDDVCLTNLPQYHAGGLAAFSVLNAVYGATSIVVHDFDPKEFLRLIEAEKVTYLLLMPPVLYGWLKGAGLKDYDLSSLRIFFTAGGSFFNKDEVRADLPGVEFFYLYSQTENFVTTVARGEDIFDRDSVGRVYPALEWRIVDDADADVPTGTPGELVLRARSVVREYYRDPEETERAWRGGWFHTGDLLRADDGGCLYFEGRVKDLIKSGGENVYAARVEAVLVRHDAVREAAVVGVRDDRWGERVSACIVVEPGAKIDPTELTAFCRGQLAAYEIPKSYHVVDALPVNPVGKILKREIRAGIEDGSLGPAGESRGGPEA